MKDERKVEFSLPRNSRIRPKGKAWAVPSGTGRVKRFKIYRYDPESGENPRYDTFELDLDDTGPMVLDALLKIKNEVDTLTSGATAQGIAAPSMNMNAGTASAAHRDRGLLWRASITRAAHE